MRDAGGGPRRGRSPEGEGSRNTSRRPSESEDENESNISETTPQLTQRDPDDMLETYNPEDFVDEDAEEEEEEEEDALELVVETLTGVSYRVRVSQWDTAAGLKDLLYRTQGIQPSYQHLILGDRELVDDACLIDQQVVDGSTLRLVLALRGGPINARRLQTHEDQFLRGLSDYMDANSQEVMEGVNGGRTVTLLLYRDEDNVIVYRMVENKDGTYSPLNESWGSSDSGGRGGGAEDTSPRTTQPTEEERRTMARMAELRVEMDKLRLRKKKKKRKAVAGSNQTSLSSSLRSVPGRLDDALTTRLDLGDSGSLTEGGGALPTPRKRSGGVKRLVGVRRGSRPTTQERLEFLKSSHGRPMLRELPTANPPVPVDFSRRKPLEAIRSQVGRGRLEAVDEVRGKGDGTPENGGRRSRASTGTQHEAWPSRDPSKPPLHMLPEIPASKHSRYDHDRLNHSHNQELLRPARHTAGRRPKTSPEVLERLPGTLGDGVGERFQLRQTDDRLRELCSILEPSRGNDSRQSLRHGGSPSEGVLPPLNLSSSLTGGAPPPRSHRSNSVVSLSRASLRTRGATPPSPGQGALVTSGSRERRDALRSLMRSQGGASSRPDSGRTAPAPGLLPPVTPKRRKGHRKPRCEQCSRRLGVSSTYECRCGGVFCAQHRYAETHTCTFDYRTAGRAMLAMANPLVAPNRVPKM